MMKDATINLDDYISIPEFAKRVGVTPQAIYKKLSTELSTELVIVDNRKMLKISALERYGLNQVDNQVESVVKPVDNQVEPSNETVVMLQKTISLLETQAETLQKQLEVKDHQIEDMNRQIGELNERLKESHILIDQQQKLQAVSESRLELLEDKVSDPEPEEVETEAEKKHWWQIFKKKG